MFVWNHGALTAPLSRARRAQGELVGLLKLLRLDARLQADADVLLQDALHTSRIEDEAPNPEGIQSSIAYHLKLPTAGCPPSDHAADGLVQLLLDATLRHDEPLTRQRLNAWHASLFPASEHQLSAIRAGMIRSGPMQVVSGRHQRQKIHYEALPPSEVSAALDRLLSWFRTPSIEMDGLIRAGIAHLWFEQIHPYDDGNGRVGRAFMDMALAQDEKQRLRAFSLSMQFEKNRSAYYQQLEQAGRQGLDVTSWLLWFLEQVEQATRHAIARHTTILTKARFWLRFADERLNERQRKALSHLLDSGRHEHGLTVLTYTSLAQTSRATASRELIQMEALGCLIRRGKGRSTQYDIQWEALD